MADITIDLNCDLAEGFAYDQQLMPLITSANIACGVHAGDPVTMRANILLSLQHQVAIGAHPSLWDKNNFGRKTEDISPDEARALIQYQLGALKQLAAAEGARINHLKLHGAFYHIANRSLAIANAIIESATTIEPDLIIFAPPSGEFLTAAENAGLKVAREVFADRRYQQNGELVSRENPSAEIKESEAALQQALDLVLHGQVRTLEGNTLTLSADTLCLHGDNPQTLTIAKQISTQLKQHQVKITAP